MHLAERRLFIKKISWVTQEAVWRGVSITTAGLWASAVMIDMNWRRTFLVGLSHSDYEGLNIYTSLYTGKELYGNEAAWNLCTILHLRYFHVECDKLSSSYVHHSE